MNEIKVSVLIPIYNHKIEYVTQCLESLQAQTMQDIEFILIDNGATQESKELIDFFVNKDTRFTAIHLEANKGYGVAMNIGIQQAKGEYIGIVESDDFVEPNMFEELYSVATQNDVDFAKSGWYKYKTVNNKPISKYTNPFKNLFTNKVFSITEQPEAIHTHPSLWSAIYKKTFIVDNNIKFLENPNGGYQDTSFNFKCFLLAKKIILLDKAYLYYRQDNENSSIYTKNKIFAVCDEFAEITQVLNKYPELKAIVNHQKLLLQFRTYIWNLKRIDTTHWDEFIAKFKQEFTEFKENGELTEEFFKETKKIGSELLLSNTKQFKFKYLMKRAFKHLSIKLGLRK